MTGLHIRCRACKRWLAGPLVADARLLRLSADDTPDALAYAETPEYLVVCAVWQSRDGVGMVRWDCSPFVDRNPTPTMTSPDFGCCGTAGDVFCPCGECLGSIESDCHQLGVIHLARIAIELSSEVDDDWQTHVYSTEEGWLDEAGVYASGQRHGTWTTHRHTAFAPEPVLLRIREYRRGVVVASTE